MNQGGKFAAITDNLLARKGEARPWQDFGATSLPWREDCGPPLPSFMPTAPSLASPIVAPKAAPKTEAKPEPRPEIRTEIKVEIKPEPRPEPTVAPFVEVRPAAVRPLPMKNQDMEFSDLSTGAMHHADELLHHGDDHEKVKKCTVRMSLHDYERLGIIAVKKNVTRQHLLQEALENFFDSVTEPYQKDCACLNAETCCQD